MIKQETLERIQSSFSKGMLALQALEPLKLSEHADQFFYLSAESSYIEGKWKTLPYQRPIMNAISNDDIEVVNWIKSARTGYTKIIVAAIAYFAEHKKRNQVVFQPVDDDADDFVKDEINPMTRDVPAVQRVFPSYNSRSKDNTLRKKVFLGSTLDIRGGKSAKNYRRLTKDVAIYDELEAFDRDIDGEGSPLTLGDKRISGSVHKKSIRGSTPNLKQDSLIEDCVSESGNLFKFFVPCPHCNEYQDLKFGDLAKPYGFRWDKGKPETTQYMCEHCSALFGYEVLHEISERGFMKCVKTGIWIDENDHFRNKDNEIIQAPRNISFHVWTAYSHQTTWETIVTEFLESKDNPVKLKTWVNTTLGETWEDKSEGVELDHVVRLRETYDHEIPMGINTLTFGADIQGDRIELEIVGWGEEEESWSIDYIILPGDTTRQEVWNDLSATVNQKFLKPDGLPIALASGVIDSGFNTQYVYDFIRNERNIHFHAGKGMAGKGLPVVEDQVKRMRRLKSGIITPQMIGVDGAKFITYSYLTTKKPGAGYCHFPSHYDDEYFAQLTAERMMKKKHRGYEQIEWVKTRPRNEALDCRVYAYAAYKLLPFKAKPKGSANNEKTPETRPSQRKRGYLSR